MIVDKGIKSKILKRREHFYFALKVTPLLPQNLSEVGPITVATYSFSRWWLSLHHRVLKGTTSTCLSLFPCSYKILRKYDQKPLFVNLQTYIQFP